MCIFQIATRGKLIFLSGIVLFVNVTMVRLILLFGLVIAAQCTVSKEKTYTTKYDNVDLDDILKNERLLKSYVDCLLEKGTCTPDGLELRSK